MCVCQGVCGIGVLVEYPNNGQVGALTFVQYSDVVLYWGVL